MQSLLVIFAHCTIGPATCKWTMCPCILQAALEHRFSMGCLSLLITVREDEVAGAIVTLINDLLARFRLRAELLPGRTSWPVIDSDAG